MRKAVFFDRDGTLMEEVGYCGDPGLVRMLPGAVEAVGLLRDAGYRIVIVTNQSGIGRGYFKEADFAAVQQEFLRQLQHPVDAVYYSADAPDVVGSRRKPSPAMLLEAAAELGLDLTQCYMVGDREGDIQAGRAAGCKTVLTLTGYGKEDPRHREYGADVVVEGPLEAARWILNA